MNNAPDYPEPYEFNTEGVKVIKLFSNKTSLIQSLDQEVTVVAVQFLSHVRSFVAPWSTACQAHLSFTISWSLLKLISMESMMLSNHLILCYPLLLLPSIFPSTRVFSSELVPHIRWPKYWSFSISTSNEYSGFISFRVDSAV